MQQTLSPPGVAAWHQPSVQVQRTLTRFFATEGTTDFLRSWHPCALAWYLAWPTATTWFHSMKTSQLEKRFPAPTDELFHSVFSVRLLTALLGLQKPFASDFKKHMALRRSNSSSGSAASATHRIPENFSKILLCSLATRQVSLGTGAPGAWPQRR